MTYAEKKERKKDKKEKREKRGKKELKRRGVVCDGATNLLWVALAFLDGVSLGYQPQPWPLLRVTDKSGALAKDLYDFSALRSFIRRTGRLRPYYSCKLVL